MIPFTTKVAGKTGNYDCTLLACVVQGQFTAH
jgi:hypothetical protein